MNETATIYRIERCRSQHTRDIPQTWEVVATAPDLDDAIAAVQDWRKTCRASGDQFRAVYPDGTVIEEYR